MSDTLQFNLISRSEVIYSSPVAYVNMPSEVEGYIGILPDHLDMVIKLGTGVVRIYPKCMDTVEKIYIIDGGYASVEANVVSLIVKENSVLYAKDIQIEENMSNLHDQISVAKSRVEQVILNRQLDFFKHMNDVIDYHIG